MDADAPCDSGGHLGSGRVYLRHWLPSLLCILHVISVGSGHPSVRDSYSGKERFQMSRERAWLYSILQDRCCRSVFCNVLWCSCVLFMHLQRGRIPSIDINDGVLFLALIPTMESTDTKRHCSLPVDARTFSTPTSPSLPPSKVWRTVNSPFV